MQFSRKYCSAEIAYYIVGNGIIMLNEHYAGEKHMKKIIGLYASSNKGKSTTLNKLIDLLEVVADNYEIVRINNESYAWFELYGKKVVVCTKGDYGQIIQENVVFAKKYEYDIFVTATRTKGGTTAEITGFAERDGAELVWIQKEDDEAKNNLIASELFSLIVKNIAPDFESSVH